MAELIVYTTTRHRCPHCRRSYRHRKPGRHRLVHAADGGCRVCPLAAMDPIHVEVAR